MELKGLALYEKALHVHEKRVSLISENIANANTPGFKAKDIDFRSHLSGSSKSVSMSVTDNGHIQLSRSSRGGFVVPSAPSLDGNTVDVEQEKFKLMEASQRYSTSLEFLNGAINSRMKVIKGD